MSLFVQGDNVLLSIPTVHVEEGGGGAKEASHNRSNNCNRLQGGEFLPFNSNSNTPERRKFTCRFVILQARWYCNKSCFYGGDIGGHWQFKGNIIELKFDRTTKTMDKSL